MKRSTTSGFAGLCPLLTGCQVLARQYAPAERPGICQHFLRPAEEKLPLL